MSLKRNKVIITAIFFLELSIYIVNAQDTIVDLSLDRFITIKLNDFRKSDGKEFLISDSINNKHYYDFTNAGDCKYSRFNPKGNLLLSGYYSLNDSIEYYTINVVDPKTTMLIEESYYRIKPRKTGKWLYYSEKGNLIKTEQYENNVLIDETF